MLLTGLSALLASWSAAQSLVPIQQAPLSPRLEIAPAWAAPASDPLFFAPTLSVLEEPALSPQLLGAPAPEVEPARTAEAVVESLAAAPLPELAAPAVFDGQKPPRGGAAAEDVNPAALKSHLAPAAAAVESPKPEPPAPSGWREFVADNVAATIFIALGAVKDIYWVGIDWHQVLVSRGLAIGVNLAASRPYARLHEWLGRKLGAETGWKKIAWETASYGLYWLVIQGAALLAAGADHSRILSALGLTALGVVFLGPIYHWLMDYIRRLLGSKNPAPPNHPLVPPP